MQKHRDAHHLVPVSVLAAVLCFFTACATGGTSTGNSGGGTPATTPQPTKAVKTKPQGPITIDLALCERILSKTEAGQITKTTITNIHVITDSSGGDGGGSCNYETAPLKAAVFVALFPGGAAALQGEQTQLQNEPDFKGSITPISGLGDAAIGIVNPITAGLIQYHVSVAYGTLFIDCVLPKSSVGDAASIDQLKQVAQLVVDRI
ncbi:MAG: hypothetical protein H0X24_03745 [Ktedonobacterales bacterium]|nr:hypothetical protein [Ktedonobacterales bacterium]